MQSHRQALPCNVLKENSTVLPDHYQIDKTRSIITLDAMSLYGAADMISGQRLGCIVAEKQSLQTPEDVARFRMVILKTKLKRQT